MRSRVTTLTISIIYLMLTSVSSADGVRRYSIPEIESIYRSSLFYFDREEYQQAARVIAEIQFHQHTIAASHIEALVIMENWKVYKFLEQIDELISLGIARQDLIDSACDYALDKHLYRMYAFCSRVVDDFLKDADVQIRSMLNEYYEKKDQPFHEFPHLSELVNKYEVGQDYTQDIYLIRNRIRAVLEEKNCNKEFSDCFMPSLSIAPTVRRFIYKAP